MPVDVKMGNVVGGKEAGEYTSCSVVCCEEKRSAKVEEGGEANVVVEQKEGVREDSTVLPVAVVENKKRKSAVRTKMEEGVCFICFDGGDLVLCDRRGCPKAYHPLCVDRDEAYFKSKGRWYCGWHLCSICQKDACYMCYTCPFSLCSGCIKDAVILCVRGNKGFCEMCMKLVMLVENGNQQNMELAQVDFNDKSRWEYLFKDYWLDLKGKLFITLDEISKAKNPWKGSIDLHGRQKWPGNLDDASSREPGSDNSSKNVEIDTYIVGPRNECLSSAVSETFKEDPRGKMTIKEMASKDESSEWASKELLEFVMHLRNAEESVPSLFDVQALLLEYIAKNKLRNPRWKSQIICDSKLQNLFGKPRVLHFEMLRLLESHFLVKEDS